VTWPTSANFSPIGSSLLGPIYAIDRQQIDAHHRLMPHPRGGGIIIIVTETLEMKWIELIGEMRSYKAGVL